ncbi:MAG: ABC transporter ATPase [Bacteroidia bacterium]|nr:ABC transporter ATPase [Bacteroidia bacterium]
MRTDLSENSRVWLYQAERTLNESEILKIKNDLAHFCISWTAHDKALKADSDVLYQRFILLVVDESATDASGCSIDKSVRKLKELSAEIGVDFFDRLNMAYLKDNQVHSIHLNAIEQAKNEGNINDNTLFFNTLVNNLGELGTKFILPLNQHWINQTR